MTLRAHPSVCFSAFLLLLAPLACGGDAFESASPAQAGASGQGGFANTAGTSAQGGQTPAAGAGGLPGGQGGEGGDGTSGQSGEAGSSGEAGTAGAGGAGQGGEGGNSAGAGGETNQGGDAGMGGDAGTAGAAGEGGGAGDAGAGGEAGQGGDAGSEQGGDGGSEQGGAGQGGESGTSGQAGSAQAGTNQGGAGAGGTSNGGAGQGGAGQGGAGQGGAGAGGAGNGGAGNGGTGGSTCGPCPLGQGCGYGGEPDQCGGKIRVRSGYVVGDGSKALAQGCDVLANGALDCSPETHVFTTTPLPPTGVPLEKGVMITSRFLYSYFVGAQQKIRSGYLESGGQREWVQICDLEPGAKVNCDPATHPFQEQKLPPLGLNLPSGVFVSGRYQFLYEKNGKRMLRDGYVQSDGAKSHSQTCDVLDNGNVDCAPDSHPFQSFAMPPTGITLPNGQSIRSRTSYLFLLNGQQVLRNSFLRSDGQVNYVQTCTVGWDGAFTCPQTPLAEEKVPALPLGAGQTVGTHYTFTFVE